MSFSPAQKRAPRRRFKGGALLLLAFFFAAAAPSHAQSIPASLSDQEFWKMVTEFSEPSGYFRSENFVGNETSLQHVLPELTRRVKPGGVYLGVAPDQNFTFIAALKPKMVFILDIRRQNLIQHLLYKSLMEMSPNRVEFLQRLFSRQLPAGTATGMRIDSLLSIVQRSPRSQLRFNENLASVVNHLMNVNGFSLSAQDTITLAHVYDSFFRAGPDITYNYPGSSVSGRGMPTYASMVSEVDLEGVRRGYLASEQNYAILREMQQKNLIVPVVGDFGGPRALRTIGQYVRERNGWVTTFYTSNVEQYLFQSPDVWARFYSNLATLPLDSTSTLIRSAPASNARNAGVIGWPGPRSTMLLSYLAEVVTAFRNGRIVSYQDVLGLSR